VGAYNQDSLSRGRTGIFAGMGMGHPKRIAGRLWRFTKWAVGWPLAFLGFIGLPDTFGQWAKFFDKIFAQIGTFVTDPRVQYLATKAVEISNFVNQTPVRVGLVIVGLAILVWGWRPFWSARHRLFVLWRHLLGEETWVDHEEATKIIRASRWARMREPRINVIYQLSRGFGIGAPQTEYDRDLMLFAHFIEMTLRSFEENRGNAVRVVEKKKQYEEEQLKRFIDGALDAEVIEKFGKIPT
jgi:hypothetical protein